MSREFHEMNRGELRAVEIVAGDDVPKGLGGGEHLAYNIWLIFKDGSAQLIVGNHDSEPELID